LDEQDEETQTLDWTITSFANNSSMLETKFGTPPFGQVRGDYLKNSTTVLESKSSGLNEEKKVNKCRGVLYTKLVRV
jgi:hypothetical protein